MSIFNFKDTIDFGLQIINKVIPDPVEREKAAKELMKLENKQELDVITSHLSAIVMEAQSKDPWTSRARPGFLYVMYVFILFSIPMGILSIFSPDKTLGIATGMEKWFSAIPTEMWTLFGLGYLGYVKKRSDDKADILSVKRKLF